MRRRRSFQIGGELAGEGVGGERKHAEALQRRDRRGERAREAAALGGGDIEGTTSPEAPQVTPGQRQFGLKNGSMAGA
jgi:hypothetical protein